MNIQEAFEAIKGFYENDPVFRDLLPNQYMLFLEAIRDGRAVEAPLHFTHFAPVSIIETYYKYSRHYLNGSSISVEWLVDKQCFEVIITGASF